MTNHDNAILVAAVTQSTRPRRATWSTTLRWAIRVVTTRATLASLDDRLLSDIGLSRGDAIHEAARKPWDLAPVIDPTRRRSGL